MKRFRWLVIGLVFVLALWPVLVLADTIDSIITMTANPSTTSIILTWDKPASSNATPNTVIRYRTDTYPTSTTDGVLAYNGTASQTTVGSNATGEHGIGDNVTPLTAGQVYYFSAWGQSNTTYSATVFHLAMSTTPVIVPSGAPYTGSQLITSPTIPSRASQTPTTAGFNFEPFASIIKYFNEAPGGFGMPEGNAWETIAILFIVFCGLVVYIKSRNWGMAFFLVFMLSIGGVGLHLVQGYLVALEAILAGGVLAFERYLQ